MKKRMILLFGVVLLSVLITLSPLLDALLAGAIVSYLTYPLYEKFYRIFRRSGLAAFFTTVIFALPFLMAFYYLAIFILEQTREISQIISGEGLSLEAFLGSGQADGGLSLGQFIPLASLGSGTLFGVKFIVFLISMYYFTTEYSKIKIELEKLLQLEKAESSSIFFYSVDRVLKGMLYGYVLTSLLVMFIASIAYAIIGVTQAFFFGFLTGIFALLPVLGAWMVFVPIGVYQLYLGNTIEGVGIIIFGIVFFNVLQDFYIRPRLGKSVADVHPMYTIVGFIAGPIKFGIFGLILGPLALGLLKGLFDGFLQYYFDVLPDEKSEMGLFKKVLTEKRERFAELLSLSEKEDD